jgi:hypothetical protein
MSSLPVRVHYYSDGGSPVTSERVVVAEKMKPPKVLTNSGLRLNKVVVISENYGEQLLDNRHAVMNSINDGYKPRIDTVRLKHRRFKSLQFIQS